MLVSNNSLLNILLPNENKVLKDVLKEADSKTLNSMKQGNTTVGDILKNLFDDLKTGDKSKATIENMLKESNLFKDLGSFTKSLESLLKEVNQNPNLSKYQNNLESFQKNISQLDNNSLKDLISKSGVFLESKILNQSQANTNLPKDLETILNQVKTIIKDIPTLDAKKVESLIDKIIQNNSNLTNNSSLSNTNTNTNDLKSLLSQLQNLSKNIGDKQLGNLTLLTNNLKNILNEGQLIESKIANQSTNTNSTTINQTNPNLTQIKETLNTNTQQILSQLKNELSIIKDIPNSQNILKQIDTLIQAKNPLQQVTNLNNLILALKDSITTLSSSQNQLLTQQNVIKTIEKLETIVNNFIQTSSSSQGNERIGQQLNQHITQQITNQQLLQQQNTIQNDMKTMLLQMQDELVGKTDPKSLETQKNIDKMLVQIDYYQLLSISSNSNSVYIPFIWDMLDDGSISMKKLDEEKFYCEINLSLKEFGQTQLLLSLYDKNKLDLTIYASNENFKQSIRENSIKLKQALNSVDLIPVNINIIELKKEEEKPKEQQQADLYKQNMNLGFGIDIKA